AGRGFARVAPLVHPRGLLSLPGLLVEGRGQRSALDPDGLFQVVQALPDRAGQLVLANEQLPEVSDLPGRVVVPTPATAPVAVRRNEEIRDEAGQYAEQGDPRDQEERPDDAASCSHWVLVAVTDRGDRDQAPPDRVARRVDIGAGGVLF